MQNVAQGSTADNPKLEKVNVHHDIGNSSTPHSTTSSPAKSETETYSEHPRFMSDSSESEEDSVSEVGARTFPIIQSHPLLASARATVLGSHEPVRDILWLQCIQNNARYSFHSRISPQISLILCFYMEFATHF